MLHVEIWSDIICPFCFIGKRQFEKGLQLFTGRDQVQVSWRSFELDPQAKKDASQNLYQYLASKYGKSLDWAKEMSDGVAAQAANVGLEFNFAKSIPTNTFDGHRLLHMARAFGKENALQEDLFNAHFRDGLDLGKHEVLIEQAKNVGMDGAAVKAMLESQNFAAEVRAEEELAQAFRITGVPAFVVNRKYLVTGAQAPETFAEFLEQVLKNP